MQFAPSFARTQEPRPISRRLQRSAAKLFGMITVLPLPPSAPLLPASRGAWPWRRCHLSR